MGFGWSIGLIFCRILGVRDSLSRPGLACLSRTGHFVDGLSRTGYFVDSLSRAGYFVDSLSRTGYFVDSLSRTGYFVDSLSRTGYFVDSLSRTGYFQEQVDYDTADENCREFKYGMNYDECFF